VKVTVQPFSLWTIGAGGGVGLVKYSTGRLACGIVRVFLESPLDARTIVDPVSTPARAPRRRFRGGRERATDALMAEERIGVVLELWRFPVKSMGGERVTSAMLGPLGLPGDRGWALRDEAAAEIRGAKKLPALLGCAARYRTEPAGEGVPHAEILLPDGRATATDDPTVDATLSTLLGRAVALCARRPASDRDHYRRGLPDDPDMMAELRQIFGRTGDEPLPDLSVFPPEIMEFTSPLGTYFDAFPIHLLTTASLAALGPAAQFDVRRFRPNVVVETTPGVTGLAEAGWGGRAIRVGGATLRGEVPTPRCVMVTLPQRELSKDPSVLRTIVHAAGQNLGLYASVVTAGAVAVGDPVVLA